MGKNLRWNSGAANPSGIGSRVFSIRKADIAKWPQMTPTPTNPGDYVNYVGDIEMVEGKTGIEIYSTQGTGDVTFESVGEKDCKGYNNKFTGSYPDLSGEALDFAYANVNDNSILIAQHFLQGGKSRWCVIGGQHYDPESTYKGTSGKKMGEKKGLDIEATAGDFYPLPGYSGIITLEDGVYDCATDTFTPKGA